MRSPLHLVGWFGNSLLVAIATPLLQQAIVPAIAVAQTADQPTTSLEVTPSTESDRLTEAARLLQQGLERLGANQYDAALESFQHALELYQNFEDLGGQGLALWGMGKVYVLVEKYPDALDAHQRALRVFQDPEWQNTAAGGNRSAEATTLGNIGGVYVSLGDRTKALEYYQQALTLYQTLESHADIGATLYKIGEIYRTQEQYEQAMDAYQQAATAYEQAGDRYNQANSLYWMGTAQQNLEQYSQALATYQPLLITYQALEKPFDVGSTFSRMGEIYRNQEQYEQAIEAHRQAATAFEQAGDRYEQANSLYWMGTAQQNLEQYSQALATYQPLLTTYQSLEKPADIGHTLSRMGEIYRNQEQYEQAIEVYQQAATAFEQAGDRYNQAESLYWLGDAHENLEQYPPALAAYQQALSLYQALGKTSDVAYTYDSIGDIYVAQGQGDQAQSAYQQALGAYQQVLEQYRASADRRGEARTLDSIGYIYIAQERFAEAQKVFQQEVTIGRQIPDRFREMLALFSLGHSYRHQGVKLSEADAHAESIPLFQQSIEIYQQAQIIAAELKNAEMEQSIIQGVLTTHQRIAWAFGYQQKYPQAIAAWQQTLEVWQSYQERLPEIEFLDNRMDILGQLGIAYSNNSQYAESVQAHQASTEIAERLGDVAEQVQSLGFITSNYNRLNQYDQALAASQQALAIVHDKLPQDRDAEMEVLTTLGLTYDSLGQYDVALEHYRQALTIAEALSDVGSEISLRNNIGTIYSNRGQYLQALEPLQQAWQINQAAIHRLQTEGIAAVETLCLGVDSHQSCLEIFQYGSSTILNNLGAIYHDLGRYPDALEAYQQALAYHQAHLNRYAEATVLGNIGVVYLSTGEYAKAIAAYQQEGQIARTIHSRSHETYALGGLGYVYGKQGQYPQALKLYQQALQIAQEIGEPSTEATLLGNLGRIYNALGRLSEALAHYQASLDIRRRLGETIDNNLNNIALISQAQGQPEKALEFLRQALEIARTTGEREAEALYLSNIAGVYVDQADYAKALELQQQASSIQQALGGSPNQWSALAGLGELYFRLGQYDQSLTYYQQALQISRDIGDKPSEATALSFIGGIYWKQGQLDLALEYLQQALHLSEEMGDVVNESRGLSTIGRIYQQQGKPDQAVEVLEQALQHQRDVGVRPDQGDTLTVLGLAYGNQGNLTQAVAVLQEAIAIHQQMGADASQSEALANLGKVLSEIQPEVAIVFYKQSVNLRESIRTGIRGLSQDLQQSYTNSVSDTYRQLADLLLTQGRILEAQQVLDLLKLQELREFNRNERSLGSGDGIALNPTEQQIVNDHGSIVAFGQKVYDCEQSNCAQLDALLDQRRALADAYNQRITQLVTTIRANRANDDFSFDPNSLNETTRDIVDAQPGTVLVYPFVQDKKLWILWTAAGEVVGSKQVDVTQERLRATVIHFRQLLQDPTSDVTELQAVGKQLYDWIIAPIETELATKEQPIRHLVFAQDRILRYVPMAALFDGQQYLMQRYTISTILSADLTDMGDRLDADVTANPVLALGLSDSVNGLDALPNVESELNEIVRAGSHDSAGIYPGQEFLNQDFTLTALERNLRNSRIVHIATHGAFVAGLPDQSYLVLGNGDRFNGEQINRLGSDLRNVNLVVLSACETALGGAGADGIEVAGISSYFLAANRASTVMASLWLVNDASTSLLMQQFYSNLAKGMGKAAALQTAQQSLLDTGSDRSSGDRSSGDRAADGTITAVNSRTGLPRSLGDPSHPYYWAPFIIIGNGL